ncbi:undecaprenyl diphosphate synthase family protein [Halapricum desulfuricans]|uniref:Undecaprenyl pyrophosphate synthase n=1 Tax=Halapricum desulfuricans TaxID=2841257 RepID=A0A897NJK7_9EURY|nr:undecaprenyl diphosphate synthase family protein [Halapricum desulfuricans]QSG14650.1 Undecaprenyl pyrophosphate synthase [Halapricum desulfuricans]
MGLYDRYLAARIRWSDASLPESVAVVLTERDLLEKGAYETLERSFDWVFEYGADHMLVYVSVLDAEAVPTLRTQIGDVDTPRPIAVRGPDDDDQADAPIQVSIGLGGKHEFATAVRGLAEEVADGRLDPDDVDESEIEKRLVFPTAPDLVVKTGAERLSDFMIWQSVYSELYFTDVNWRDFRKRDYLRALRDYQTRQRRFGR